ncbi:DNA polymerase III subunit gamma and tau [Ornithinimicrobium sp. LYQ103]|uniref:DNA polymerase III subunit gamma and tau n=1 Tax=Ornithinimicrobium sp. LYQ103 TaxID=3378796 RepID=UPI003852DC19
MSTALYRRYRPESFADVIGQEHVTEPLMQALRSGRVNHAYLFSGPRGCGKTTSARILARCLNCEEGPTPEPCGVCESCVALARDGAGSIDVIEIDAASHGGVDDARDLRERAAFGPAQSRYKVYIIDEAHMVTPNGFNALLKVVEEPPPHVKFIFATTEPEKVLATIRSRTHHYPFHLVPPQRLTSYLEQVCGQEGAALEPGVLSFVTRAGGGSVRDSLSVLDQLISGAGEEGLTYERTAALLGFTDVELIDAVVDAVAAGDAATVFQQVDKVMESGHDPRRFVEDLLERYRDLIVLAAVGEQAAAGGLLPGLPEDQIDRMRHQAKVQGPEALSHAADVINRGLSEMSGAVSFRLMLELLVARLLLPTATGEEGYGARLDRIERRLAAADVGGAAAPAARRAEGQRPEVHRPEVQRPASPRPGPVEQRGPEQNEPEQNEPDDVEADVSEATQPRPPGALDTAALRRQWPDVLERVRLISRRTWSGLQMAVLLEYDGQRVLLGMPDEAWVKHFVGTQHQEALRQALIEAIALDTRIEAVVTGPRGQRDAEQTAAVQRAAPEHATPPDAAQAQAPPLQREPQPQPQPEQEQAPEPPEHEQPREAQRRPAQSQVPQQIGADVVPPSAPRVRTRAGQQGGGSPAWAAAPSPPAAAPPTPASAPGPLADAPDSSAGEPSMAEQLGAARPTAPEDGQDWARQAASSAAPAWVTSEAPAVARPVRTRAGGRPGASAPTPAAGGRSSGSSGSSGSSAAEPSTEAAPVNSPDAPRPDDEDLASSGSVGQPVIENVLGGRVIAINDDPVG